ncbi:lysostaphin resistance A-like protein [Fluviibacterium sp. S390]|uniref:CPBP family intramembrane glutamic endopeptidase n=1 Tax=Fluviibacterium sp. S390 TaxID=3415139 RepID=UPI003C7A16C8
MPARPLPPRFAAMIAPARARPALWRLAPGLLLLAVVYLGLNAAIWAAYGLSAGWDRAEMLLAKLAVASTPATALILLASFAPMALGAALAARLMHRRPLRSLTGPGGVLLRHAGIAGLVGLAVYTPALGLWHLAQDSQPNLPPGLWARLLPLTLAAIALQTFAEELVFRGYLQGQLAVRFARPLIWAGLPALVFGALHHDPARMGDGALAAVIAAVIFGLLAADLTARTGSIGAAWGLHFVNNTAAIALLATPGTITGLGLRVTPYTVQDLGWSPIGTLTDLIPLVLSWLILRRILPR